MTGNVSIDIGLENIWRCWLLFRKGKKKTIELEKFQYHLVRELLNLHEDLDSGKYAHGQYQTFMVHDPKRREISVAPIRDRIIHRIIYEHLEANFDQTFSYDIWSCRMGKGLHGAIERVQTLRQKYPNAWIFRADVHKFFDHVHHGTLKKLLRRKILDKKTLQLLDVIIDSHSTSNKTNQPSSVLPSKSYHAAVTEQNRTEQNRTEQNRTGIPIGNLTSQIFANIYLNELDRFVQHTLKPLAYVRYGDDFLIFTSSKEECEKVRACSEAFLAEQLFLTLHCKRNLILPPKVSLRFLGVEFFVEGRRLMKNNRKKVVEKLNNINAGSYSGLVMKNDSGFMKTYLWASVGVIDESL